MKKISIVLLVGFTFIGEIGVGQINTFSGADTSAITITPFGIQSKNSQNPKANKQRNVALGPFALENNTGDYNTAVGYKAGANLTGINNVIIGDSSFTRSFGNSNNNVVIGSQALKKPFSSGQNVVIGAKALNKLKNGWANIAIGNEALYNSETSESNIAIGDRAMFNTQTSDPYADENIAIGKFALYENQGGERNTVIGSSSLVYVYNSLNNTSLGFEAMNRTLGNSNTALGAFALKFNEDGEKNVAIGDSALFSGGGSSLGNGSQNVAIGQQSMLNNTNGSFNTAVGKDAMKANTTGNFNSALGIASMLSNTTGTDNVAMGTSALRFNTAGDNNTALGVSALRNNTASQNTAVGRDAGRALTTGINGVFIGMDADVTSGSLSNSIAIGYNAKVNSSNKAVIGNASVTTVGGYGSWTNYSDKRLKSNIVYDNKLGLDFILGLKTANYSYKGDQNQRKRDGFIAQDVEELLKKLKLEFSGLVIDNDKDRTLNLSYAEFVMPLVNAIQDQQEIIEKQNQVISAMNGRLLQIENQLINSNSASK